MESILISVIIFLGALVALLGLIGVISPPPLLRTVAAFWNHPHGLYLAIVIRLGLGIVLVTAAPQTHFPLTVQLIGILAIVGALLLPFIGRQRILRLIDWWTSQHDAAIRLWSVVVILFGLFLIYACR